MVKDEHIRTRKYEKSIDGTRIGKTIAAQKDIMVDQEKPYFANITMLERKIKALCEAQGIPTYQIAQYINYGRQLYSKSKRFSQATLAAEAQYLTDLWTSRGLLGSKLVEIAALFGVTPSAAPTPTVDFLPLIYNIPILKPPRADTDYLWMHSLLAGGTSAQTLWDADMLIVTPYPLTRKIRFDRIGFYNLLGVANGKARLGLYDSDNDNNPNVLLAQSDEFDCSLPGLKETAIDVTLEKGLYWLCCVGNKTLTYPFPSCWISMIPSKEAVINNGELYKTDYPYQPFPATFPYDVGSPLYGERGITLLALRIKELL